MYVNLCGSYNFFLLLDDCLHVVTIRMAKLLFHTEKNLQTSIVFVYKQAEVFDLLDEIKFEEVFGAQTAEDLQPPKITRAHPPADLQYVGKLLMQKEGLGFDQDFSIASQRFGILLYNKEFRDFLRLLQGDWEEEDKSLLLIRSAEKISRDDPAFTATKDDVLLEPNVFTATAPGTENYGNTIEMLRVCSWIYRVAKFGQHALRSTTFKLEDGAVVDQVSLGVHQAFSSDPPRITRNVLKTLLKQISSVSYVDDAFLLRLVAYLYATGDTRFGTYSLEAIALWLTGARTAQFPRWVSREYVKYSEEVGTGALDLNEWGFQTSEKLAVTMASYYAREEEEFEWETNLTTTQSLARKANLYNVIGGSLTQMTAIQTAIQRLKDRGIPVDQIINMLKEGGGGGGSTGVGDVQIAMQQLRIRGVTDSEILDTLKEEYTRLETFFDLDAFDKKRGRKSRAKRRAARKRRRKARRKRADRRRAERRRRKEKKRKESEKAKARRKERQRQKDEERRRRREQKDIEREERQRLRDVEEEEFFEEEEEEPFMEEGKEFFTLEHLDYFDSYNDWFTPENTTNVSLERGSLALDPADYEILLGSTPLPCHSEVGPSNTDNDESERLDREFLGDSL